MHRLRILGPVALLAIGIAAAILALGGSDDRARGDAAAQVESCARENRTNAKRDECLVGVLTPVVRAAATPAKGLDRVRSLGEGDATRYLGQYCHNVMHGVGTSYAKAEKVGFGSLQKVLPADSDAGCSAGFAHGVITYLAPSLDPRNPAKAERAACDPAPTRYLRYSCTHGFGHAFMRVWEGNLQPALRFCARLGARSAPDCAQGAYHDYWLASVGAIGLKTNTKALKPRALCAKQPAQFVVPCWYRAFLDTRPAGYRTETAEQIIDICRGTRTLQRRGCIAASSVIGSPNPLVQLDVCGDLPARDVDACVEGVKVANLPAEVLENQTRVLERCGSLPRRSRSRCVEVLAKEIGVLTDRTFLEDGCPGLSSAALRRSCRRGIARMREALVTYA